VGPFAIDLPDLVEVEGSRGEAAEAALPPSGSGAATFDGDLRRLRRRVIRSWALATAARCALAALAVAVIPAALAAAGAIGWAWAIAVPVVLFVLALAVRLSRPPSLAEVARLLDDRLGLFDVTATALDAERSGAAVEEGPAAPVFAEAAALLHAGAERWRPRARFGRRGLGAAAGLVVILAALVAIGTGSGDGGSATKKPVAVAPRKGGDEELANEPKGSNVSPPLVPRRLPARGPKGGPLGLEHRSPLGLYVPGLEGKRPLPKVEGGRASGTYNHGKAGSENPDSFADKAPGEGNEAREKAEEEAAHAQAAEEAAKSSHGGAPPGVPQRLKSLTGGKAAPGSVTPLPNGNSGAKQAGGRPGTGEHAPPPSEGASGEAARGGAGGAGGGVGHQGARLGHEGEGREGGQT
jgi:hypothetical protein